MGLNMVFYYPFQHPALFFLGFSGTLISGCKGSWFPGEGKTSGDCFGIILFRNGNGWNNII